MRRLLAACAILAIASARKISGRAIHFALCHGGRFRQVCNETARTGSAQGRAAGFYPDQLAACGSSVYPWKTNIVTTVFWVGEQAGGNNPVPNYKSSWTLIGQELRWNRCSDAGARRNYIPIAFIPKQNPFYCALPYNDVTHGQFKPEAPLVIPWFKHDYRGPGHRCAGIVGLRFVKAIARVMRNGRTVARFAQTIFSMSLEMSVLNRISITVLAWMFHRPCAITWHWRRPM